MLASGGEINGLTDDLLANAPTFTQIWPDLVTFLTTSDAPLYIIYGTLTLTSQASLTMAKRFQFTVPEAIKKEDRWRCTMELHARWYGE